MTLDDLAQRVAALERIVRDGHAPKLDKHGDTLERHEVEIFALKSTLLAVDARTTKMANMMTMQDAALERLLRQSDRTLDLLEARADTAVTKVTT